MDMYRDWSDEALDEHRRAILTEQERRANLAAIPEQIAAMAKTYRDGGGDEAALRDALTPEEQAALNA
ncbi:hypothetical protein ACFU1Q_11555 [Brachybacterium paraconglomeratum]